MKLRWMTSDGSPWWLRSTSYTPTGTYHANCFMDLEATSTSAETVTFSTDAGTGTCAYHSDSYYCQPISYSLTPAAGSPDACTCKKVQLVGDYSAGVLLKCEQCNSVRNSQQANSCPAGTKIFSPETRVDWTTFLASTGPLRAPDWIVDITKPQDGCTGCYQYAMKWDTPEMATWQTKDGSPWWLRSTAKLANGMGDNGLGGTGPLSEYKANCYLNLNSFHTADTIVFESKPTGHTGNDCPFSSSSYYCQSVKTTTTTTTRAKCDSLYTVDMCPSGHLADGQNTRECTSNPCNRADDDTICCKARAKCNSLPYAASMCTSGVLAANQAQLECASVTCMQGTDDGVCCAATCGTTYTCATGSVECWF
jgi:hypothetical protein